MVRGPSEKVDSCLPMKRWLSSLMHVSIQATSSLGNVTERTTMSCSESRGRRVIVMFRAPSE
jgi:hypothetical protein